MKYLSTLREIAHAAIAVLGGLAASGALLVVLLGALGVHNVNNQVAGFTGICGAIAVLLSKAIDSASYTAIRVSQTVPLPAVTTIPPGGP